MSPTIDVEITSETTARAILASAAVDPVDLQATETETLEAVVHRFLHSVAKDQNVGLEVVYRKGENSRHLTVLPNGKVEPRAPSTPIPTGAPTAPPPARAANSSVPPTGPVVVAAESIIYQSQPAVPPQLQTPAPNRRQGGATQSRSRTPQHQGAEEAVTGPLEALVDLVAAPASPVASDPARLGLRGRLNAALGLKLVPKEASLEMRLRDAQTIIAGPLPDRALIGVMQVKGGVGKTPLSIALTDTIATYRGSRRVVCADLGEVGGSFSDRVTVPPAHGSDVLDLLAEITPAATDVRPTMLRQYLTQQPSGADVVIGGAATPLGYDQAQALGMVLSQHRDLIVADTGNSILADSWQWVAGAAHVALIPVPIRTDAAIGAQRTLKALAAVRPDLLSRTVIVITDGPGDIPADEHDIVERFSNLAVPVCRMPYEPRFAGGKRIALPQLRRPTQDALTVLAATAIGLMGHAAG
ncbi:ParA family protein (plasmid) [Rhodococcus pseudokoreensis]|uniref:ParA family protein n=1 Tax=Rhodococcus pseudokoreensis TaxID=2811421 RepID=A0A974VZF6_9NOCA|nr:ParA family protein [Rhodococcus pseudokoreensis]QSE88081.1 ParA family protein [Rhodococcus pseudokoreensis]